MHPIIHKIGHNHKQLIKQDLHLKCSKMYCINIMQKQTYVYNEGIRDDTTRPQIHCLWEKKQRFFNPILKSVPMSSTNYMTFPNSCNFAITSKYIDFTYPKARLKKNLYQSRKSWVLLLINGQKFDSKTTCETPTN